MPQTLMLSQSERAVVETSLQRMVGNCYGAMATLPLYCVGDLSAPDPASMVMARHDVWHSYLVVAREMLRSTSLLESVAVPLDCLLRATDSVRDAFVKLLNARTMTPAAARAEYDQLASSYERIPQLVEELGQCLDLGTPLIPERNSLKWVAYQRSLRWFGEELNKVAGTAPVASTQNHAAEIE